MASESQTTPSIVERFGSVRAAVAAAERIAALDLADEHDGGPDWATQFIQASRSERHLGDCAKARWWERAPMTCAACVYDEFMNKAWRKLGVRHGE